MKVSRFTLNPNIKNPLNNYRFKPIEDEEDNEPIKYPTIDSHQLHFQNMKAALVARINNPYFA